MISHCVSEVWTCFRLSIQLNKGSTHRWDHIKIVLVVFCFVSVFLRLTSTQPGMFWDYIWKPFFWLWPKGFVYFLFFFSFFFTLTSCRSKGKTTAYRLWRCITMHAAPHSSLFWSTYKTLYTGAIYYSVTPTARARTHTQTWIPRSQNWNYIHSQHPSWIQRWSIKLIQSKKATLCEPQTPAWRIKLTIRCLIYWI